MMNLLKPSVPERLTNYRETISGPLTIQRDMNNFWCQTSLANVQCLTTFTMLNHPYPSICFQPSCCTLKSYLSRSRQADKMSYRPARPEYRSLDLRSTWCMSSLLCFHICCVSNFMWDKCQIPRPWRLGNDYLQILLILCHSSPTKSNLEKLKEFVERLLGSW